MRSQSITLSSGQVANASANSTPIDVRQVFNISLQVISSAGSLAGTFQLQTSNLPYVGTVDGFNKTYAPTAVQWTNLGTALTFAQASAATSQVIAKTDISNVGVRLVYTDSSSGSNTATFSAYLNVQGI
jgi:hypothetical protein